MATNPSYDPNRLYRFPTQDADENYIRESILEPRAKIVAGFDREVDAMSVDLNSFLLDFAGADGIFDNADDMSITAASISVPGANPQSAVFDLTGVVLADGNYRVTLKGSGNTPIMDLGGNILDGEYLVTYPPSGDGVQGGDFVVQFSITTPIVLGPTLTQIQAVVFGPTCATANCHSGAVPDANLDLSDEATSRANLVGVSVTRELGPLMAAIIVAARCGSSIAAEIGTMVVTEEVDAIKVMALDPKRFLVAPRGVREVKDAITRQLLGISIPITVAWSSACRRRGSPASNSQRAFRGASAARSGSRPR